MRLPATLFVGAVLLLSLGVSAQVNDLVLSGSGDDIVLSWGLNGNAPYRVLRTRDPSFTSKNHLVADGLLNGPVTDVGVLSTTETFFYVVLDSTEDNPRAFDLNTPRLVPTVTLLSPAEGRPGDTITINGTNFPDDGRGLTVHFGSLGADILTVGGARKGVLNTELTVLVPEGTVTSDVVACVAAEVCSNTMRFTVTVGGTYQNISSLAFEPGTGSLWLGDRGSADDVLEIDTSGNTINRSGIAEPYISNVSPGDGSGRIYFGNGTISTFNGGTTRFVDSASNSTTNHRNAGTASSDPVWARGIVANDSQFDVCYYLDGNNNTIRRVPKFGGIDANWGDTSLLSFNDPAGGRFDSSGNLYVSSTTDIYKIASNQAVSLLASGFTAAAGLDLSEDTGIPTLLVADEGTGEVFLVDGEDGSKTVVGTGFSGPVAAVFSEDPVTNELYYDVAEATRIIRLPDPRIEFNPSHKAGDVKVLISKHGSENYPSTFQTEDRKIRVEAIVIGEKTGLPEPRTQVYFRVVDPKDGSSYASTGKNDNKDTIGVNGIGEVNPTSDVSDDDGKVSTILTITGTYSGDNYKVEASLKPHADFKRSGRSAEYIAWKRAYVEYDRMYKVGEFLTQTSGADESDPAKLFVENPGTFTIGDEVHVFSGSDQNTVNVLNMEGETTEPTVALTVATIGADHVVLSRNLNLTYSFNGPDSFPFSFIARVTDGYYDVGVTKAAMDNAFDDAHVDLVPVGDGDSYLPSWPSAVDDPSTFISDHSLWFFKGYDWTTGQPKTNYIQLVAAGNYETTPPILPDKPLKGRTSALNNWSWIFTDAITNDCGGCSQTALANFLKNVSVHELVHQWNINVGNPANGGHDNENAAGRPVVECLMNEDRTPTLGVARLHDDLGAPSHDLYCIRGHVDDLNQDTCNW